MGRFMICDPRQILSGRLNQEERDGREMCQARCREKVCIGLWWENLRERRHLVIGSILLEYTTYFQEISLEVVDKTDLAQDPASSGFG